MTMEGLIFSTSFGPSPKCCVTQPYFVTLIDTCVSLDRGRVLPSAPDRCQHYIFHPTFAYFSSFSQRLLVFIPYPNLLFHPCYLLTRLLYHGTHPTRSRASRHHHKCTLQCTLGSRQHSSFGRSKCNHLGNRIQGFRLVPESHTRNYSFAHYPYSFPHFRFSLSYSL